MIADHDPLSPAWRDDPYSCYRVLRDSAPVQWSPSTNAFCVSRYDDVMFVLRNPELFSSRAMFTFLMNQGNEGRPPLTWKLLRFLARFVWRVRLNPLEFTTARNLIAEDGESHTAMRAIVNRGFTPRRIGAWEARAQELVAGALAKLRSGGSFDLVADLAIPLPVSLITEMLGVEPARQRDFKRWSDNMIYAIAGPGRANPFEKRTVDTIIELLSYLRGVAEARRRAPADDLVSLIVSEQEGETALSIREVIQFVMLLLVAGNETTTNLIGNASSALLDHPSELARLAADPSLVPGAIEEALRFDSPVQVVFRTATQDVDLAGTRIPKGALRGAAARLGQSRRAAIPRPRSLRPGPQPSGPRGLRLRQALLSGRVAGAPRGAHRPRSAGARALAPRAPGPARGGGLVPGARPSPPRATPRGVAGRAVRRPRLPPAR